MIHVCYPDCGHGSLGIHMSKLIKLCTLNMCSTLYVNYTLTKLLKMINETSHSFIIILSLRNIHSDAEFSIKYNIALLKHSVSWKIIL